MRAVRSLDRHTAAFGRCEPNPEPIDWHAEEPSQRRRDPSLLSINFISSIIKIPNKPRHFGLCQVQTGADVIAPSAAMDGQVKVIRQALDAAGYQDIPILAYSAK